MKKILLPNIVTLLVLLCCITAFCQIKPSKTAKKSEDAPKRDSITDNVVVEKLDFEKAEDLQGWKAAKGTLQLSEAHFKDGKKSMLLDWNKGTTLEITGLKE